MTELAPNRARQAALLLLPVLALMVLAILAVLFLQSRPAPAAVGATPTGSSAPPSTSSASPTSAALSPSSTPNVTAVPSNTPEPSGAPAAKPPAPAFVGITNDYQRHANDSTTVTETIRWVKDGAPDATVKVYGVNKCFTDVYERDCVTDGMRIPARNLLLLAQAPASAGEATWDYWVPPEIPYFCGQLGVVADRGEIAPPDERYYAIVLRSENQAGKSAFVVADTVKNADYTC